MNSGCRTTQVERRPYLVIGWLCLAMLAVPNRSAGQSELDASSTDSPMGETNPIRLEAPVLPMRDRLREQIEQLRADREKVAADVATLRNQPTGASSDPRLLDRMAEDLNVVNEEYTQRIERLRRRLFELRKTLLRRQRQAELVPEPAPPEPPPADLRQPFEDGGADIGDDKTSIEWEPELDEADTDEPPSEAPEPTSTPNLLSDAVQVTKETVDQHALADNLFATGEVDLALKLYQSIQVSQLEVEEQAWIWYQIACCHRILSTGPEPKSKLADAERFFRRVVGSLKSGPLFDSARWWLEVMHKRAEMEEKLGRMDEQLKQLTEATDEQGSLTGMGN